MQKFKFVIFGSIAALVVIGGLSSVIVQAAPPESKIYGCVTGINGNITQVKMTPHTCPAKSTPIEWSVGNSEASQGPKGDTGLQGPAGEPGPQGIQGLKGDPGYSYEEALASVSDPDSEMQAMTFGTSGCTGQHFTQVKSNSDEIWCYREFPQQTNFYIHGVKAAGHMGQIAYSRPIWMIDEKCPTTVQAFYDIALRAKMPTELIDGQLPVKIKTPIGISCMWMTVAQPYWQKNTFQVVYSTN